MPRHSYTLDQHVIEYQQYLGKRKRRERTGNEYGRLIRHAMEAWHAAGLKWTPRQVGEEEIDYLYNEVYSDLEPLVARTQLSIIGTWLKRMGKNPIVETMEIEWPQSMKINAVWLNPLEARALMDHAQGMVRFMVHLELFCLLRRCEVLRLEVQDFKDGSINLMGKGRQGGKPRTIPFHPKTLVELERYLAIREELIERARTVNPAVVVPDAVMIYEQRGHLYPYHTTALDNMLRRAGERAGLPEHKRCHHALRRGGARIYHLSGMKTRSIMKILGHSSEEQTIQYMGLNLDDMSTAMQGMDAYWEATAPGTSSGTSRAEPAR